MENYDQCPGCTQGESDEVVSCHHCSQWFHYSCAGLTSLLVDKIEEFFCNKCEENENKLTKWKKIRADQVKRAEKRDYYFEIEKIVKHHFRQCGRQSTRLFLIKWKGYPSSQNTWELEYHLDACFDVLQKYLKDNKLAPSTIDGVIGASKPNSIEFNEENWVSMKTIFDTLIKFKKLYFPNVDIDCENWISFEGKDKIYLLRFQSHCYIILYYSQSKTGYIADGGNLFRTDEEISRSVRHLLKIRLFSCQYNQQEKIDHCGSSAVLIALEMMRAYKLQIKPSKLSSPISWRKRIIAKLHKHESVNLNSMNHEFQERLKCNNCSKIYRPNERRSYFQHISRCSK